MERKVEGEEKKERSTAGEIKMVGMVGTAALIENQTKNPQNTMWNKRENSMASGLKGHYLSHIFNQYA